PVEQPIELLFDGGYCNGGRRPEMLLKGGVRAFRLARLQRLLQAIVSQRDHRELPEEGPNKTGVNPALLEKLLGRNSPAIPAAVEKDPKPSRAVSPRLGVRCFLGVPSRPWW